MIYFDNAATTYPKPASVLEAVQKCMIEDGGNPGRSGHRLSAAAGKRVYECRCAVAELFHSECPENVIFTLNATYALNLAIKSSVSPGDHILISDIEHNSVVRPVIALAGEGVSYSVYRTDPDPDKVLADIKAKLRKKTRMIVACLSSNLCGIELPIARIGELCKSYRLIFAVDAAQSAGTREIDLEKCGISVLCAPGHKGLYGPQGSGFALFSAAYRNDSLSGRLRTLIEGGNGVSSLETRMPAFLPERLEAGTLATPCLAGLCEGIRCVKELGQEAIYAHENRLYRYLREELLNLRGVTVYAPEWDTGSILLFNIGRLPSDAVADTLDKQGIAVRAGFHCSPFAHKKLETGKDGAVRVSFSMYNTKKEADALIREINLLCKG